MFNFDYITKEEIKEHNQDGQNILTIHAEY